MTPQDILSRKPNGLVCSDCNAPNPEVQDQPMPQCLKCYAVTHTAKHLNLVTCIQCSYSYSSDEWNRCPNDDCVANRRSPWDTMRDEGDSEIDPEAYFDELGDDD